MTSSISKLRFQNVSNSGKIVILHLIHSQYHTIPLFFLQYQSWVTSFLYTTTATLPSQVMALVIDNNCSLQETLLRECYYLLLGYWVTVIGCSCTCANSRSSKFLQCNTDGLVNTYKEYSKLFNLVEFYDKLVKPVLYKIGDLWKQGKLDVATKHASTNTINSFVKVIEEQVSHKINTRTNVAKSLSRSSICKIMICTPEGELHNVSCNMIESLLASRRYKVYNI
jgi:hypothetical protein